MSKNILGRLTLVVAVAAALFLSGCGGDSQKQEKLRGEAEDMVEVLKADVDQFRDGAEQNDDLTMLAFRVCYLSSWL